MGSQPTFLEGTLFRLNFDKHAFGDSSYVKNYLTASKGTSFNNINYKIYGPFYIEDSVVAINFSTNDSLVRPNRIAVSTTPLQLVHLKFRVKNCQATAKMKFVDPVICDILTGFKVTEWSLAFVAHKNASPGFKILKSAAVKPFNCVTDF